MILSNGIGDMNEKIDKLEIGKYFFKKYFPKGTGKKYPMHQRAKRKIRFKVLSIFSVCGLRPTWAFLSI